MSRVSFHTLGCKLNFAETSTIQREFEKRDFVVVPFGDRADVTVVNTCSVTAEADRKCRNVVRRALRANPDAFIVVTGCYAQLKPEEIGAIEGVDLILGAGEKFALFQIIDEFTKCEKTQVAVSCIDEVTSFGPAYSSSERTRAFLKVQDGCDYSCSFCTIPLARGRSRSAPMESILEQACEIARRGFKEIVLSGVNIGLYGQDYGTSLLSLLLRLEEVEGIERYRISSIEPNLLTDEVVDFVASSVKFQPHFHIPLQSGDDHVLGRMRRRYRRAIYADRVLRIKALMPHACIGSDVIAGFPAERDEHFENTCRFITDLPVSYLHVFTYSERPNTSAVQRDQDATEQLVPKAIRSERNRVLRLLSRKKERAFYQEQLGSMRPVLWEGAEKDGTMLGYSDNYVRVEAPYDARREGRIEDVRLDTLTERGTVRAGEAEYVSLL